MEKYFLVRVTETLAKTYKIKAETLEEAVEKVENEYYENGIVLDYDDYDESNIEGREVTDECLDDYNEL